MFVWSAFALLQVVDDRQPELEEENFEAVEVQKSAALLQSAERIVMLFSGLVAFILLLLVCQHFCYMATKIIKPPIDFTDVPL